MTRLTTVLLFVLSSIAAAQTTQPIAWHEWTDDPFKLAASQHKFVLLDLGTNWCHWCHVMDVQTYADAKVQQLLASKYIAVKVDADSRPDLANRYEDYGWPATVVFNSDGSEIVKRRGFLTPDEMASMLQAIIDDPTPGPSVTAAREVHYTAAGALSEDIRKTLLGRHSETYDAENGAWGHTQKFLDWDSTEFCMRHASEAAQEHMAIQTLHAQLNLLDPAWGGVYQYSTDSDWKHPHFEKIMQMQAENLRIYSLAYAKFHGETYLKTAQAIHGFLARFLLGENGAFYTSQDADLIDGVHSADYFALSDSERRARGIPHVDTHQYSRENGWAITALATLYEVSGDSQALAQAKGAANWVIHNRLLPGGGFSHDAKDPGGPYLGDSLAMGRAFLELYIATSDKQWLSDAQGTSDFITAHFLRPDAPGVVTSQYAPGPFAAAPEFDENTSLVRWASLLSQFTGRKTDGDLAKTAMRYLASPDVALARQISVGGILLADDEVSAPAVHIVIVGSKSDPGAKALFQYAMTAPTAYKRLEWLDKSEGPLMNSDVEYPTLPKPAAFLCTGTVCSLPSYTTDQLQRRIDRALK